MDKIKIARELVKVARELTGRVKTAGYKEELQKLKDNYEKGREDLLRQYMTSPDFKDRPREATDPIRKDIVRKVGGKYSGSGSWGVEFRMGSGYSNSAVTRILKRVVTILKRHKVTPPSNLWDLLDWRDGDGVGFVSFSS